MNIYKIEMKYKEYYILLVLILLFIVLVFTSGEAKVTGSCANCHTMHNSQNNSAMATYGATGQPWKGTGPFRFLVRGDCLGCHGMGTSNKIVTIGGSEIPQVYHTDPSGDLAGGNFAYITGAKGSGASDGKGHNVKDLGNSDDVLNTAPGVNVIAHDTIITDTYLTCAGFMGCHGMRYDDANKKTTGLPKLKGAHHQNVDGKCDTDPATAYAYNSYRFLVGVKGLENTVDKWQNKDKNSHNEYFGASAPLELSCSDTHCHNGGTSGAYSPNGSISVFCGTCHGMFHDQSGIGGISSPFKRHPTDVSLPASGEYLSYTVYSTEAPVARTTVPDSPDSVVRPGTDVVMCLSCHAAHGTNYPDILRWDRRSIIVAGGGSGGCFTCHTEKAAP
jgi:predicted CXXCH cytochrome family protein